LPVSIGDAKDGAKALKAIAGSGDVAGEGAKLAKSGSAAVEETKKAFGPYHRLGDSSENVANIAATGELRGSPPRNFYQSDIPAVKAYEGPLPAGQKGFEFTTPVAPDTGSAPGRAIWSTQNPAVREVDGQAVISCTVTKIGC
jgi:hypothetical protein